MAIVTGAGLGPKIAGQATDMVTIVMEDPFRTELFVYAAGAPTSYARIATDGSSFNAGGTGWLAADKDDNAITAITEGDLIYFTRTGSGSAVQTVTKVDGTTVTFGPSDPFNFNQQGALAGEVGTHIPGAITEILPNPMPACDDLTAQTTCHAIMKARRIYMYTYYVQEDDEGVPHLMRAVNHFDAQVLAGVIETLELSYDLVDGSKNPTNVKDLPYKDGSVTYDASQIRKVNVHIGVRSEQKSARTKDYLRSHVSTVISLRNLAYVDRYVTEEQP
jgi:hypothetical protein